MKRIQRVARASHGRYRNNRKRFPYASFVRRGKKCWALPEHLRLAISGVAAMRGGAGSNGGRVGHGLTPSCCSSEEVQSATLFRGSFQADVGEDRSTFQLFLVVGIHQTTTSFGQPHGRQRQLLARAQKTGRHSF